MANTPDLSQVINMIMENPSLVSQISAMANNMQTDKPKEENADENATPVVAEAPKQHKRGSNRARLLGAMKPYLSEERGRAIDTMISIAEILEISRGKD